MILKKKSFLSSKKEAAQNLTEERYLHTLQKSKNAYCPLQEEIQKKTLISVVSKLPVNGLVQVFVLI